MTDYKPVGFNTQTAGGFGTIITHQITSAPIRTFILKLNMTDELKYVLQFNGKIVEYSKTEREIQLDQKILSGDLNGQYLLVGTLGGLFQLDMQKQEVFKVLNYQNAVLKIVKYKNLFIICILDLRDGEIQFWRKQKQNPMLYSILVYDPVSCQVIHELRSQSCCGHFDVADDKLYVPSITDVFSLQTYSINEQFNFLKLLQKTIPQINPAAIAQFTYEVVVMENGLVHFFDRSIQMAANSRVNNITKVQKQWLFCYQDGKIILVNEGFDNCYLVYDGKKEIASFALSEGDNPSCLIGFGNLQAPEDSGEVMESKLKNVQGIYSIGK